MFYALSKVLDVLLSPLGWALALSLAAPLSRSARVRRWTPLVAGVLLYVCSIEPVSNRLVRRLELSVQSGLDARVTYDAVILLGGVLSHDAMQGSTVPSYNDNVERLLTTFDLLRMGRTRMVVISGGRGGPQDRVVEARALGAQLEAWGIDRARILLDDEAKNTRENAAFSRRIVRERGLSRVLLVTSAFHMPRAMDCFRAEGLAVDALPVDYRSYDPALVQGSWLPRAANLADSEMALREMFGRAVYRVVGYGK